MICEVNATFKFESQSALEIFSDRIEGFKGEQS
jgi:hypothetical protein